MTAKTGKNKNNFKTNEKEKTIVIKSLEALIKINIIDDCDFITITGYEKKEIESMIQNQTEEKYKTKKEEKNSLETINSLLSHLVSYPHGRHSELFQFCFFSINEIENVQEKIRKKIQEVAYEIEIEEEIENF